jgi:hypothetical protein
MAVTGGMVSFIAMSTTASSADFRERLGVEPTQSWELGDPARQADRERDHAAWILDRDLEVERETLDAGLLNLLRAFEGRETDLDDLRAQYDMFVQCYGSSDSTQGGFVLGATVMRRMAALGLDLVCTIYLENEAPERAFGMRAND